MVERWQLNLRAASRVKSPLANIQTARSLSFLKVASVKGLSGADKRNILSEVIDALFFFKRFYFGVSISETRVCRRGREVIERRKKRQKENCFARAARDIAQWPERKTHQNTSRLREHALRKIYKKKKIK